jgi:hypothetical protein
MPSRAEFRGTIEGALRAISIGLLAWMLWLSLDQRNDDKVESTNSARLAASLREWSSSGIPPKQVAVQLDKSPSPADRDWLAALDAGGSDVTWSGSLPAAAVAVDPIASPRGGFNILSAAPAGAKVTLIDDVGPLDSAQAQGGGARFSIPTIAGEIRAKVSGTVTEASAPDSLRIKRVLVLGSAGWEAKFVVAALEEDGWKVDALLRVAPTVSVSQGTISSIDTARYSAVVALDETAGAFASDIVRYVASGGGAVIAGTAANIAGLSPIRPGSPGRVIGGALLASEPGATTLKAVPVIPIDGIRGDAAILDRRDGAVAAAARRHLAGRVLQEGYTDTWRWRMSGGDGSVAEHRAWWTRAVAGIAYAPPVARPTVAVSDNAPIAALVEALGPSSPRPNSTLASSAASISLWWLFGLLAASLLGEWASRRFRGVR